MLKEAGGIISSVPSNEIYPAMQTGSLDAAVTSSTSLISFRLEEISKGAHLRPRQELLVHARAAAHVEERSSTR